MAAQTAQNTTNAHFMVLYRHFYKMHKSCYQKEGGFIPEQKDTQSNKYQLTINNPLEKDWTHQRIFETFRDNLKTLEYVCMADEQGSTFHTHVFVYFRSRVRFSTIKKYFPEAHIEKTRGTASQNISYIKKSGKWENDTKHGTKIEGSFEEWGQPPPDSKGKRSDMSELYQMVSDGMKNAEILEANQDYILHIDKIDKLRTMLLTERFKNTFRKDIKVIYIYGKTGTGKTSGILTKHGCENVYRVTDYHHPFDGYNCQPVIAFDEFRSSLRLNEMLHYCDIYPVELPARYSNRYACYDTVYIISNWKLEKQYSELQKEDKESWNAFLRRIHEVRHYEAMDKIITYSSVEEYMKRNDGFIKMTDDEYRKAQLLFGK